MRSLPGYVIHEQIDETLTSIIYRAGRIDQPGTVIIKALRCEHPSAAEVARFKHEYALIRSIQSPGIIRILDIIDAAGTVALVLEDFGGVPLKEVLKGGFTVERFLELAIRLTRIVGDLHQNNISHRDINPFNILMNWEQDIIKLTDFGIAAEFTRQSEEVCNPTIIEGTLAYISPEQTGRMNCAVDYRTDLYSLGITFYEMLTGELPFKAYEAMEMVHAHIAKVPERPDRINPDIPAVLADIVMKLMSKAAVDRYQNCAGLEADLKECSARLKTTGRIEPFELGRKDIALKFIIPQVLVGREGELALLHDAFERVSQGSAEIMLVTGEPGIGKSALVGEIHKPIVEKRGYFISGKYDQFRRYVPYSSIIQAFQGLARQILSESEAHIQEWKDRIQLALGPNGRIVTDAIPEIELIIGRQPDIPELGPEETQNRFNLFFKNFVRVFADQHHPLVLFLDDLQWADSASLNLIQTIMSDPDLKYLLFIGAYRNNEVAPHHPLMLTLDAVRKTGMAIYAITLETLKPEDINQFIAYFLRYTTELCRPLAQIIHAKTKGNPFFVNQFLKNLYEENYIVLEPQSGWNWELQKIQDMQVTDNVVEFMAKKLGDLPAAPLELIRICACIGNRFESSTLAAVTEQPLEQLLFTLDALIQEGLINRAGDLYRFHHDRIQEAAYSLMTPAECERMHYRIGSLDLNRTPSGQLFNRIFYIVDQLNQAHALITDPAERLRLADLNLKAGIKAKESTAYGAAVSYLGAGIELLPEDSWTTTYELTYGLFREQMESQFLNRDFNEAERLFEIIIARARTKIDKVRAYITMVALYTMARTTRETIELGLKALRLISPFRARVTIDTGIGSVIRELIKVKLILRKTPPEKMVDLPPMHNEELVAYGDLIATIGTPAYFFNPYLFATLILQAVNIFFKHGHIPNSPISASGLLALGVILETELDDYEQGYRLGETALKINEKLGNQKMVGRVVYVFAHFIQHWKRHARHDLEYYNKVYQLSLNSGDFIYAGYSINAPAELRFMLGDRLDDILAEILKYREFMHQLKDEFSITRYKENIQFILNFKGQTPDRYSLTGEGYDEARQLERYRVEKHFYGLFCTLLFKTRILFMHGKLKDALACSEELDRHSKIPMGTMMIADHYFYYSLILTGLLGQATPLEQLKYKRIINRNQRKMLMWSRFCADNFRHKYDLVEAELSACKGRFWEAQGRYHAAIQGARQYGYLHIEGLACERLAVFYLSKDKSEEAGLYLQRAHQCYRTWGAASKVKDLEERYPRLIRATAVPAFPESPGQAGHLESSSHMIDLSTVMQVAQVISSEIVLEKLLQKIMHLSIVNAGAHKGFLILESDGLLTVEASEDVDTGESHVLQSLPLDVCPGLSRAMVNYVSRSAKPLILGNAMAEGAFMNDPHIVNDRCKSILCMPILNKGKLSGILYMENNLTTDAFTPERLEILQIIASQAAISLENAKLFNLATTDGLTKLYVNRYFHLLLDQEIAKSRRYKRSFSLIMLDIDDFKRFNDTYGHQLGDEVLRNVALAIKQNSRAEDVVARYGGEEFVMVLPETDSARAMTVAEKVRSCVEAVEIPCGQEILHVTVSLGVATYPYHADEKEALIKLADEALYVSKRDGKNKVTMGMKPWW